MIPRNFFPEASRRPGSRSAPANVVDPSESTTARLYRVQEGDSLPSIANLAYGCPELWIFILHANLETIRDQDVLRPGQILHLPELTELVRSHRGLGSLAPDADRVNRDRR